VKAGIKRILILDVLEIHPRAAAWSNRLEKIQQPTCVVTQAKPTLALTFILESIL